MTDLLILSLATWRVSHMLVSEDGPYKVFARLRERFGKRWGALICVYCMSIWVAAAFDWLRTGTFDPIRIFAISGAAMMLRSYSGVLHDSLSTH